MRNSSSTASTFAMPARKIAWLSASISLSMLSKLQNSLCHPEAGALCPPKDLGEPRESTEPALESASDRRARLARFLNVTFYYLSSYLFLTNSYESITQAT